MKMRSFVNLWADGMISGGRTGIAETEGMREKAFEEGSLGVRKERRIRRVGRGHILASLERVPHVSIICGRHALTTNGSSPIQVGSQL